MASTRRLWLAVPLCAFLASSSYAFAQTETTTTSTIVNEANIEAELYGPLERAEKEPPRVAENVEHKPTRRSEVIRAILGLVTILVAAYLAGHPRVQEFEERFGLSPVVTAGFPFVLLGLIARHPSVGVLTDVALDEIGPLLPFGLGWIGFAMGFRFDIRAIDPLPKGAVAAVTFATALPFLSIFVAASLLLLAKNDFAPDPTVLRAAAILATAGAIAARAATPRDSARKTDLIPIDRITRIIQLEELAAVVGLLLIAAFFRPGADTVGWQLPAVAWIFVTLGMGTAFGAVAFGLLASFERSAEITVILLGAIAFCAGMASYLRLSPVVVCSIAGILLANFTGTWKPQVRRALHRLERPVYLVFLFIAGALWRVAAWEGWALMLVMVGARFLGRFIGVRILRKNNIGELSNTEQRRLALAPMGPLSVAIVVNAQDLYLEATVPWLLTAIIAGGIASELIVHRIWSQPKKAAP